MTTYTYKILFKSGESFNVTSIERIRNQYENGVLVICFGYTMNEGFYPVSELKGIVLLSTNVVEEKVVI